MLPFVYMRTLREALAWARDNKVALGHFNISDSTQFNAIVDAAEEVGVPIVIGVSEGEGDFIGVREAAALVRGAREQGKEVFLNADHTHSVEGCKEAIDAGFDSVIFDGVKLPVEENIAKTKEVVEYAKDSGRDVIVEGEIGYIGTSSKLLDNVPDDVLAAALPTAEDIEIFVEKTGVSAIAPAVGNVHGMLKNKKNPKLHIDHIIAIRAVTEAHIVLHGGSGISDDDFRQAIQSGVSMVHINTEIRAAYREGIEDALKEDKEEVAPYRYLDEGRDAVKAVVLERLKLFNNINI